MTSMDISAPSIKLPSPTMSKNTPTINRTKVPVSSGVKMMLSPITMSAMGKMEVSDSNILSFSALVMAVLRFYKMGTVYYIT